MKYKTTNELHHFSFSEAHIADIRVMSGSFLMVVDNVTIFPENSCNRDIRNMRTNGLELRIWESQVIAVVEEGYKIYDAEGKIQQEVQDREIKQQDYADIFKEMIDCELDAVEKDGEIYVFSVYAQDHTFLLKVMGKEDTQEWNLFFS